MEQITVPQFLDVEDTIIGPVTVRQFIEMLVGGLLIFICYKIFDFSLFLLCAIAIGLVTITVAFIKVNGQSFHLFLLNLVDTLRRPKLQVWRHDATPVAKKIDGGKVVDQYVVRTKSAVSTSRLAELSLIVDTGGVYRGEEPVVN